MEQKPISDENLKVVVQMFFERRGLTKCDCAKCANLAISSKTYGFFCRVERLKARKYLTPENKSCDTLKNGTWSLVEDG